VVEVVDVVHAVDLWGAGQLYRRDGVSGGHFPKLGRREFLLAAKAGLVSRAPTRDLRKHEFGVDIRAVVGGASDP